MTNQIKFYIGADNGIGLVDKIKAMQIVGKEYRGFTCYDSLGFWEDKIESSIVVEIIDETDYGTYNPKLKASKVANKLRKELEQDAILFTVIQVGDDVINWSK